MTINISTNSRNKAGKAIVDLIDGGEIQDAGYIEIRTGDKPESPHVPVSGILLATCEFSQIGFGEFSNGVSIANPISQDTNIADTGVANWFRVYDRDGIAIFDGDVGLTGTNKDIEFDNINFVKGGTVAITDLIAIMPQ